MSRTGVPVWLRIPVIPGVNEDDASIAAAVALAASLDRLSTPLLRARSFRHLRAPPAKRR